MTFRTCDLGLAAALLRVGFTVDHTEREGGKLFWHFHSGEEARTVADSYFDGSMTVSALEYFSQIKKLKQFLHASEGSSLVGVSIKEREAK